jgi:hypothetical protein
VVATVSDATLFKNGRQFAASSGGALKIIAAIEDPTVIAKILAHIGLSARAPPRSPAPPFELFQIT